VVYLIKTDYHELGSSFWLFTTSIILDLFSLISYLFLIKQFEKEIKSFRLNKQLEDFKKFGFDTGMVDSVTLVGSAGSQSQTQLSNLNLNKTLPEKNVINYPPNKNPQRMSMASLNSQPHNDNNSNINASNSNINYVKNVQEGQNTGNTNLPTKILNNNNSDKKLQNINNIPNNQNVNNSYRNSMSSVNKVNSSNPKLNNNPQMVNNNITKENSNTNKNSHIESQPSSAKMNEPVVNHQKKLTENSVDKSLFAIRPKRDSSLLMNTSFSNINNANTHSIPVKSSSENKRVSNSSYILNALKEEDTSKSQILDSLKPQTQDSYLNQSDTLTENTDKNNSFLMNSMEPIYSNELESLHDIESFEEYPSIHKVNQSNSILSSSTPSQPNSQPPPQQHNQLPKPPLPQRPKSYQQFNSIPYNSSLSSRKSPTTIDDYVPMTQSLNTPSSQMARKSQRDSLLNQIFGTNNDNHSYVSMTALTDKERRETYQSFDQLPLENQRPTAENLSFTKMPNEVSSEIPNESFSQTLCHDSYSQSYYLPNSHSNINGDDSILDSLSNVNIQSHSIHGTPGQILPEKDLSHHSLSRSNHESSIFDKGANISKYSVKSLQLKNVPLNNLDPVINERINSITVNKFVNEEKAEPTKENNFDILASSSMASGYNPKEKEYYQEPYYVNTAYYEKMPYYDKVEEYKERMEEKGSVVSSLSISSSSSSLPHSSPSMNDHYKKNSLEGRTEHNNHSPKRHSHTQEADLSEVPVDDEYIDEYYKAKEYKEQVSQSGEGHHHHTNSNSHSLSHSQNYSYSQHTYTSSPYKQQQDNFEKEDHHHHHASQNNKRDSHHYSISQTYDDFNNINENILNSEDEEERYYHEDSIEQYHHHPSISSTSSEEEEIENQIPNINYERDEDDYENQKPPVTVVTIPPLSPFELPAIAIPFNQPDPREVGNLSPVVTTQATLTTKPSNYKINNHLSIPYNRNFLSEYTYSNSNGNNNNNKYNEQVLNKRSHSTGGLAADNLYSPNYYPRNSQPYPSSSHSSQKNHWPSSEVSYTSQLIQQRQQQQKNKNSMTRRSIHSNASNSSMHLKNNSGLSNTGNISIHSNTNSNDTNPISENNNITNSQPIYYYVCKQKFIPQNENEIELNVGDVVEIIQLYDDGWRLGRNKTTNCIGSFPQECITMVSHSKESPNPNVIRMMEAKIEKLKDHKKMINYLELKLQDPNLSEKDREIYQQHLDYAYLTLEEASP